MCRTRPRGFCQKTSYSEIQSVEGNNAVGFGTEADFFSVIDGVGAVTGIDALNQGMAVVAIGGMVAEHKVDTGLVEGNRVKGCQDADIVHLRGGGVAVAVAVDRQGRSSH